MKKLINDVGSVLPEMMAGLAMLNPGLALLPGGAIVVRADVDPAAWDQVALISGGGSGHEPAHGGYVGPGMLTAAVAGEIFTSPSTDAILDAIRAVTGRRGALLIVKNYTGDRLNFGLAAEIARSEGLLVEMVVVSDDVALSADGPHAGRRGLAGTVLVHKVAGAAAAAGLDLGAVADVACGTAASLGTMGVALGPCIVPAAGQPTFQLGDAEIEWGLGIHGEPGVRRTGMQPADAIVEQLLSTIVDDLELHPGSRVALMVNNLGGSAAGELNLVAGSAVGYLRSSGIVVERAWVGTFLSALEMPGCSLSVLEVDDERLARLDAPADTSAWPQLGGRLARAQSPTVPLPPTATTPSGPPLRSTSPLRRGIEAACRALLDAQATLTEMDARVGDGDLGDSLARGARSILAELDSYPTQPGAVLRAMSATVRRVVGGTSGPLYAVLLVRAAVALERPDGTSAQGWSVAFTAAVEGVRELGGAAPGDRTMVDALEPAAAALADELDASGDAGSALSAAVAAAEAGAAGTAAMTARLGRSSYVGERAVGTEDPGARAVAIWLRAINQ